jgi:hypothetical protein
VPSLSKTAIRSAGGTYSGVSGRVTVSTKRTMACFDAPSRQDGNAVAALAALAIPAGCALADASVPGADAQPPRAASSTAAAAKAVTSDTARRTSR